MAYGAEFRNDGGDVIIDGENPCCFLHEVGTARYTVGLWTGYYDQMYGYKAQQVKFRGVIRTNEPPFVCGYSVKGRAIFGYITGEPGAWTGFMACGGLDPSDYSSSGFIKAPTSINCEMRYAVYSQRGEIRSQSNWGLLVSDERGNQVFDSRKYPFILEGDFSYRRWGRNNGSTFEYQDSFPWNGELVRPPSSDSWPLLTTLNQMLWYTTGRGGGLGKVIVEKEGNIFRYGLSIFYNVAETVYDMEHWYEDEPRGLPDQDRLPNLGGGQNAYNLIVFGRVPVALQ